MRSFSLIRKSIAADIAAHKNKIQLWLEVLEHRLAPSADPSGLATLVVNPGSFDTSRLLVRFIDSAASNSTLPAGATLGEAVPLVSNMRVVQLGEDLSLGQALQLLRANPNVLYAEPDYQVSVAMTPNDLSFSSQWDLTNTGQSGGLIGADIDASAAWSVTAGSGKSVVAVIDSGVDYNHPDLFLNIRINQGEIPNQWNAGPNLATIVHKTDVSDVDGDGLLTFRDLNAVGNAGRVNDVNADGRIDGGDLLASLSAGGWADGLDNNSDGYRDDIVGWNYVAGTNNPQDDNSHGTHVAGTIGAIGNNGIGVAGIAWNVQLMPLKFLDSTGTGSTGAAINALNYAVAHGATISNNSWGGGGFSQALNDAIAAAAAQGHIFVAAAGNLGANNDTTPFYPASSGLPNVLAVAATDRFDQLASFSNYGNNSVQLAAPGFSIYSTQPGNAYGWKSGTSMAAPHVAGAVALVRDLHPTWSYQQVISQIVSTVDVLPSLAGKVSSGGRLNLLNAVNAGTIPPPPPPPPPPPTLPSLTISDATIVEGNSGTASANFTVTLSAASTSTVTVNYATADGTGFAVGDYLALGGILTFSPGENSKSISIAVLGDTLVEPDETFFVNLFAASNATLSRGQGTGTILNNDTIAVSLTINDVSLVEGNAGMTNATFTISLTAAATSAITVSYATANGTAAGGTDYSSTTGTLSFSPGETSKTITIPVIADTLIESDRFFFVNLYNANTSCTKSQGKGTILNDDTAIAINNSTQYEGNVGTTNFVFTVSLTAPSAVSVSVNFATAAGTAAQKSDFTSAMGSLVFAPGVTTQTITVRVKADSKGEGDDRFYVDLSGATNANIQVNRGTGTILNDDGPGPYTPLGLSLELMTEIQDLEYNRVLSEGPKDSDAALSLGFLATQFWDSFAPSQQPMLFEDTSEDDLQMMWTCLSDNRPDWSVVWGGIQLLL